MILHLDILKRKIKPVSKTTTLVSRLLDTKNMQKITIPDDDTWKTFHTCSSTQFIPNEAFQVYIYIQETQYSYFSIIHIPICSLEPKP